MNMSIITTRGRNFKLLDGKNICVKFKLVLYCIVKKSLGNILHKILDFEYREGSIDFTLMFIYFFSIETF